LLSITLNEFSFDDDRFYGDNALPAAPGYVIRGEVLYRHSRGFYVGPTFDLVDGRFADFANTYRVDSYGLLGLRCGWSNGRWRAFAELRNALDEKHVASHGVRDVAADDAPLLNPGEPVSAYFGLQAQF
jgi:iron complex outermembrane receptor protein